MIISLKNLINKIIQYKEIIFLILLIIIGAFLRFYRLEELMTYLGDEGRDMLIVMDMITGKNFPFIGPPTSVGKLYLGPIYYYFITPFAWIFKMSPVGPAVFVVLTGIFSIILIFLVAKNYFNTATAYISVLFYTLSPLIIKFSRSSWNPNPMPFFTLLLLLSLFYWQKTKKQKYLYLASLVYAIMLQLHYLVILMLPFLVFIILKLSRKSTHRRSLLLTFGIFILIMSPVFIFDLKHNFANTKGILEIFHTRSFQGFSLIDLLSRSRDRIRQLFSLFFSFEERKWQTDLIIISSLLFLIKNWLSKRKDYQLIIYGWFIWGILVLGLYRDSVYPHYLGFLFIFPALLAGNVFAGLLIKKNTLLIKILSISIIIILSANLFRISWKNLHQPPAVNVSMVKKIVQLILKESHGQPFNFCLLANNNYDDSYRYFFRLWKIPAVYKTEVSRQLFVVCEDLNICQPQGNPKWEIALFDAAYQGQIQLTGEWLPDPVIKVFKFVPRNEN